MTGVLIFYLIMPEALYQISFGY